MILIALIFFCGVRVSEAGLAPGHIVRNGRAQGGDQAHPSLDLLRSLT
jgi:hypothetical protein